MSGSDNNVFSTGALERFGGSDEGATGVNHVVDDDAFFALDACDMGGARDLTGILTISCFW